MTRPELPLDPIREAERLWTEHGWQESAPGMAAVTSLMRAHQLVLSRVEAVLRPLDVTFARYEVLMLLVFSRRGTLPMSRIGTRLQVHQTSVTNAVDRLERRAEEFTMVEAELIELLVLDDVIIDSMPRFDRNSLADRKSRSIRDGGAFWCTGCSEWP